MKKQLLPIVLMIVLLSSQTLSIRSSISYELTDKIDSVNSLNLLAIPSASIVAPSPPVGMEIVKDNFFMDQGFESENGPEDPIDFSVSGSSEILVEPAYQTEVINGSYSSFVSIHGNSFSGSYAYCSRNFNSEPYAYFDQDLNLEFWYNCKSNPDISYDAQIYLRFQVFVVGTGNIYMYYYLSSDYFPTGANDSTYYGYFDLRGSLDTVYQFDRNITHDFVSVFPSYSASNAYLREMYFTTTTALDATGPTQLLFDDVEFRNGTSYDFCSDNGDFEDGDRTPWYNQKSDHGLIDFTTTDYTEGARSLNLTAFSSDSLSYSEIQIDDYHYQSWRDGGPKGYYARQQGDLVISFDWKYSDNSGLVNYAYYLIEMANETFNAYVYILLGDESDSLSSYTNATYGNTIVRFIAAENFGVRDTWNHFSVDYYDLMQSFNLKDLSDYHYRFYARSTGTGSLTQLLLDNVSAVTYPTVDPSFENNVKWFSNDPIMTWMGNSYDQNRMNITTDAYSGNYAAKLSSPTGYSSVNIYRNAYLEVTTNLFTDFMWRIDTLTNIASNVYTTIRLVLDSAGHTIHYVLGRNEHVTFSNSSTNCFYEVEGFNQTGTWMNLFRNVSNDVYTAFGVNDWNITQIMMYSQALGSDEVSTSFDDIYFVRDIAGPTLSNPAIDPPSPMYTDSVDVSLDASDSTGVKSVILYYRLDSGAWVPLPMVLNSGEYTATIPVAPHGTDVSYYFEAEDYYEHTTLLGSDASPYTYQVGDNTPPLVSITSPTEYDLINGISQITVDANDSGSGIDYVEFHDDVEGLLETDDTAPYTYSWDTRLTTNGTHIITVWAFDNNGNSDGDSIYITIDNDYNSPIISNLLLDTDKPIPNVGVNFTVDVEDYSDITAVTLHLKVDDGSWTDQAIPWSGTQYEGFIPAIDIGQIMNYYISAEDEWGNIGYLGTDTDPFTYTVKMTGRMIALRFVLPISLGVATVGISVLILIVIRKKRLAI